MLHFDLLPVEIYNSILIYLEKDELVKMHSVKKPKYQLLLQFRYKNIYDEFNFIKTMTINFNIYSYKTIYYDCLNKTTHYNCVDFSRGNNHTINHEENLIIKWYDDMKLFSELYKLYPYEYVHIMNDSILNYINSRSILEYTNKKCYNMWHKQKNVDISEINSNINNVYLIYEILFFFYIGVINNESSIILKYDLLKEKIDKYISMRGSSSQKIGSWRTPGGNNKEDFDNFIKILNIIKSYVDVFNKNDFI